MSTALRRTATVELDQDFMVDATVAKAYVNETTGERFIVGVATGIEEDRDGERVSARAIRKMAATPTAGGAIPLMAATHVEDWLQEIGEVTKLEYDADHDELLVEAKLPPAGIDPIADKAWHMLTVKKRKLGFSIGGKLRKAFYELGERAGSVVKRKVLDEIALRHMTLTGRPSYPGTFAEAVAKTWDGEAPADDEFVDVEIAKAAKPDDEEDPAEAPATAPDGEQPTEPDAEKPEADEEPSDAEAAKDLPKGKGARHLACPNCGHEFAAPLSSDLTENRSDPSNPDSDDDEDTGKMTPTTLDEALAQVRAIAEGSTVEKTEPEVDAEVTVEKTDADEVDVAKTLGNLDGKIDELSGNVAKAFGQMVDVVKGLQEQVNALPVGRKSVATTRTPGSAEEPNVVGKTASREELVEKTVEDPDAGALDVLQAMNAGRQPRPISG